jgi:hypothetical protein
VGEYNIIWDSNKGDEFDEEDNQTVDFNFDVFGYGAVYASCI